MQKTENTMRRRINIPARRRARRLVLQALYQWIIAETDLEEIEQQFFSLEFKKEVDIAYFHELLFDIPKNVETIDQAFSPYLDRDISQLNPIELITIRMGVYELLIRKDIPYKVAINETIALNKLFGSEEGYKYVNGILDKVAQNVRADEISGLKQGTP